MWRRNQKRKSAGNFFSLDLPKGQACPYHEFEWVFDRAGRSETLRRIGGLGGCVEALPQLNVCLIRPEHLPPPPLGPPPLPLGPVKSSHLLSVSEVRLDGGGPGGEAEVLHDAPPDGFLGDFAELGNLMLKAPGHEKQVTVQVVPNPPLEPVKCSWSWWPWQPSSSPP